MARKRKSDDGSGVGFAILVVIAIIIKFFWFIVAGAAMVGAFYLLRAMVRADRARRAAYDAYCGEIAARADQQHNWVLQGDDRGTYGPEGAKLTRYVLASQPGPMQQARHRGVTGLLGPR